MKTKHLLKFSQTVLKQSGIDTYVLDSEILLAHAAKTARTRVITNPDEEITTIVEKIFLAMLERRRKREPVAYITGKKEFYGNEFHVNKNVLIPRPETEILVETARKYLPKPKKSLLTIFDVGTGSGCIAVALSIEIDKLGLQHKIYALDNSGKALTVANKNIKMNKVGKSVKTVKSDIFKELPAGLTADMIVSNPPYVSRSDLKKLQPEIVKYEPANALYAGNDGLSFYRRLIPESKKYLRRDGVLIFEIGQGQHESISKILNMHKFKVEEIVSDFAGIRRIIVSHA